MDYHSCRQERTLNRFLVFPVPHPLVVVPPSSSCFLAAHCNGVYTRNASGIPSSSCTFFPVSFSLNCLFRHTRTRYRATNSFVSSQASFRIPPSAAYSKINSNDLCSSTVWMFRATRVVRKNEIYRHLCDTKPPRERCGSVLLEVPFKISA